MVVFRLSVTVQIYENRNVVCTGARTTDNSKRSIREGLDALGIDPNDSEVGIHDIMASTIMYRDVNLKRVYLDFGSSAEYDPEWFAGVIMNLNTLRTTGIVYANGKLVMSGATDMDAVQDTVDRMIEVIRRQGP